ncbi:MAG TPA: HD domain-containing phosphohydrolase [Burkholderiales bacterium]|nr:HD domain-containing phosphohydrolase [Burkholderiales bacterium]
MFKKLVAVGDLQIGMYVIELDRPWLGTPFDFQGFPLTSVQQIEQLKQYCKIVYIDPERERWTPEMRRASLVSSVMGNTVYEESTPVEREVIVAKDIYISCEQAMQQALETLRSHGEIDSQKLTSAVSSMTQSIQRNPDAMMLLNTLRQKGSYELGRAMDTSILMVTFGRFLQFAKERLEVLGLAGMLLDVGKTKLPDSVLKKKDMLSPDEYELVKAHVDHSVELVHAAQALPAGVEEIIALHHERQDGTGYPRGLKGDEISIDGSVAALVDSFSALTSARAYAEQASPSNALSLMHKLRGKLFHEALVEQFIQCIGIYPVGSAVELNTGEVGIVIAQNLVRRLQPRVMVILDREWKAIYPQLILDLVKEPKATADEPYRIRRTLPKDKLPIDPSEFFL